jgi:hypothetical protein
MDVTALSTEIVQLLAPFLPFLAGLGRETAERAGSELGAEAWEHAKALWERIGGRLQERPAALQAVNDTAETPDDGDARAALRLQVRRLLADDAELAGQLRQLLEQRPAPTGSSVVAASGHRSIAVGGDVSDSRLVTGDREPNSD